MAIEIITGSDKKIVVDLSNKVTNKPFDLNGVSYMEACFPNSDGSFLYKYFVGLTCDIGTTDLDKIYNVDVTNIRIGYPVYGTGIPDGAKVILIGSNFIQMSAAATSATVGAFVSFGDITIVSPAILGTVKIFIHSLETDLLAVGDGKNFEIKIVKNGFTSYAQFPESLNIVAKYC